MDLWVGEFKHQEDVGFDTLLLCSGEALAASLGGAGLGIE